MGEVADDGAPPSLELTLDFRRSRLTIRFAFFFMVPLDELDESSVSLLQESDDELELEESKAPARTPG